LAERNISDVVMEVSSHALAMHRVDGIAFRVAAFTNLSQDHLDFHSDMEDYFAAKRRLFEPPGGRAIVNADDEYGRRLIAELGEVTTFGVETDDADYRARDVRFDQGGAEFTADTPDGSVDVAIRIPGRFNVENALAAIAAARALGAEPAAIRAGLAEARRVPGRLEPVDEGQDFAVLVDYAHTPDSLENVLRAARDLTSGRLYVVFGAGGDRDRGKRPLMGRAAATLADRAIVTSDNPRSEDPDAIIAAIVEGMGPGAETERDRRRAIALAIEAAGPGDVVLIAGKGHERGQEFEGGRREPFDDVEVAREALRSRQGATA